MALSCRQLQDLFEVKVADIGATLTMSFELPVNSRLVQHINVCMGGV